MSAQNSAFAESLPSSPYHFDSERGFWRREGFAGIGYADGEEGYLRHVIAEAKDRSINSEELRSAIRGWGSEYHLSIVRHNLLRPFQLQSFKRVLEIGAGCGAITRQLGEAGLHVTAVEGSAARAEIAALRCADLPNVSVYLDSIDLFTSNDQFDLITSIGVLEYAPCFIRGEDPLRQFLETVRRRLAPNGVFLLAIENRLGLKYFNGRPEDHLGTPYVGLFDGYQGGDPVTFGRQELSLLLERSGFSAQAFFYPFPDYKLPTVVVADRGCRDSELNVGAILSRAHSRSYGSIQESHFDEGLVWQSLERNHLIPDLANSFLVACSANSLDTFLARENWLAKNYSLHLGPAHSTETTFKRTESGLVVTKELMSGAPARAEESSFRQQLGSAPYVSGRLHIDELRKILLTTSGPTCQERVVAWARQWAALLMHSRIRGETPSDSYLPGHFVDCIPSNLVCDQSGELHYIDQEWRFREELTVSFVLARGLAHSLWQCRYLGEYEGEPLGAVVEKLLRALDIQVTSQQLNEIFVLDHALSSITSRDDHVLSLRERWRETLSSPQHSLAHELQIQRRQYEQLLHTHRFVEGRLREITTSRWWKILARARRGIYLVRQLPRALRMRQIRWRGRLISLRMHHLQTVWGKIRSRVFFRAPAPFRLRPPVEPYESWREVNQWNSVRESSLRKRLADARELPLISVVVPVYNPELIYLERMVHSVLNQIYERWELCLADDASTDPLIKAYLTELQGRDSRIRVVFRERNGNISAATNSAAEVASGEFIALLDQDDELAPDALGEMALRVVENPEADLLYSDDDKIDAEGRHYAPQFKPDWSPELLLSFMYLSHLLVVRRSLFTHLGGMRLGFEGSQDYDFALRASEHARAVEHVARPLYHWRALPSSTAASGHAKPSSFESGRRAVEETLQRRSALASVIQPDWAAAAGCGIFSPQFPDYGPPVSILIPTRDRVELLRRCILSIQQKTTYSSYEIVVLDNESRDPATHAFLARSGVKVVPVKSTAGGFNFAEINNRGVPECRGEFVLFLNNDTEIINPRWLSQMVGLAQVKGVGAVGARLLYPDNRVHHAGIVHGLYDGLAGPAFKFLPRSERGYLSLASVNRDVAAVTAACMLMRRDRFLALGGFNQDDFAVAYNDVDLCYRIRQSGERIVYCADAELYHFEGATRGYRDNPKEPATFRQRYRTDRDPYYNGNLSLGSERYEVGSRVSSAGQPLNSPLRTLVISHNLNWEGAPLSQFELIRGLHERRSVKAVVYSPLDGPLRTAYERLGIEVRVVTHPLAGAFSTAEYDQAIDRFCTDVGSDWDLVYANTTKSFYGIEAARKMGIPSVWNIRESEHWARYFDEFSQPIAARALECFQYPYQVVFVAHATAEQCKPLLNRRNGTVIHNGLDAAAWEEKLRAVDREAERKEFGVADEAESVVLLLGTVCRRKGQLDLLGAVSRLPQRCVEKARFVIVGDRESPYSRRLHRARERLEPSRRERVLILEERDLPERAYRAADIFVCTSRVESYPRVILEAMQARLPIISTPVFGIREQIVEGVNGLFYRPGKPAALARHLEELILDPDKCRTYGEASATVLSGLTDHREMVERYEELFSEAVLSGGPRACAE